MSLTVVNALDLYKSTPDYPPDLISGLLQDQQIMMLAGPSKAGKSFLLLTVVEKLLSGGMLWDTFKCRKSRVLYVDMECGKREMHSRISAQISSLNLSNDEISAFSNLSFVFSPSITSKFESEVIETAKEISCDVIIIDPIFSLFECDENSSFGANKLMQRIDAIRKSTGCSVIICHHHSKGVLYDRTTIDRSAGSGVLARYVDAILDMSQFHAADLKTKYGPNAKAFTLTATLRHFADTSLNVVFDYPLFKYDPSIRRKTKEEKATEKEQKRLQAATEKLAKVEEAFTTLNGSVENPVKLQDLAKQLGGRDKSTVRGWINNSQSGAFTIKDGFVYRSADTAH